MPSVIGTSPLDVRFALKSVLWIASNVRYVP